MPSPRLHQIKLFLTKEVFEPNNLFLLLFVLGCILALIDHINNRNQPAITQFINPMRAMLAPSDKQTLAQKPNINPPLPNQGNNNSSPQPFVNEKDTTKNSPISTSKIQSSLLLSITVDDISHLKVEKGARINRGQVIADNSFERKRLAQQRKAIVLQIGNIESKKIPKPIKPQSVAEVLPLPPAEYDEEQSNIAQAQLKLQQAESILSSSMPILKADDPEKRANMEKAEAKMRDVQNNVQNQQELINEIRDMKFNTDTKNNIIQHETAKLKKNKFELEQAQSAYQSEQAKLNNAGIQQQQELKKLQINVQLARSEVQLAKSKLKKAKNNRKKIEYQASIDNGHRLEEENRSKQLYEQQLANYEQATRDKDYQLAQLQNSLRAIDDKIAVLPTIHSPRDGYIRRIKPWVGNNGKYTTVITISDTPTPNYSSIDEGS